MTTDHLDSSVVESLQSLGTATLHEAAAASSVLPSAIHTITHGLFLAGRALPVAGPPADNLWIHRAVDVAEPGDVLVIDVGGHHEAGYWGEVLSSAARAKGIAGVVIDGSVRDSGRLTAVGVPVFARGLCMRGTTKLPDGRGHVGKPVTIGDASIHRGDIVVGDEDGVLVLPAGQLAETMSAAFLREEKEARIIEALGRGDSTMVLLNLPRESA